MKNEFILAFNQVLEDKQLPKEIIVEAIEAAMVSAYRKEVSASESQHVEARLDIETGDVEIYAEKEVVEDVQDERTEVLLENARKVNPDAQLGEMVVVESTPKTLGRVAAQTARQVIQQRIREAERNLQFEHFSRQKDEIVSGIVQAINNGNVAVGMDLGAEGILARKDQIPGERFHIHDRVRALLVDAKISTRGPQITLSRAHRKFLQRLLENEVPEIYHGVVEIRSIAREPGYRSKVAVAALKPGIDPVGACVGIRGVRIQAIVRELHDEKIDVIEWNPDPKLFIAKALSPARVVGVYLDENAKGPKTATVVVPEDQLSLAIGRDGQNARLSAKLTSWRIDIKSQMEATSDVLFKLQNDAEYADSAIQEQAILSQVEAILAKKQEGRPVTPEEYQIITKFVERVENGIISKRQEARRGQQERMAEIRARIPAVAFSTALDELDLSERLYDLLAENGYASVGDLMFQLELDSDAVLKINGVGPKAISEINACIAGFTSKIAKEEATRKVAQAALKEEPVAEAEVVVESAPLAEEEPLPTAEVELMPEEVEELQPIAEEVQEDMSMRKAILEEEAYEFEPDMLRDVEMAEDEVDDEEMPSKKKKKKKFVEVEYDPDQDVMIVKRKRKRGGLGHSEWDEW